MLYSYAQNGITVDVWQSFID